LIEKTGDLLAGITGDGGIDKFKFPVPVIFKIKEIIDDLAESLMARF